ncbi:hypothetical protein PTTG_30802, partial [Puccinia triticina 1-1 BBBD Race 1]
MDKMGQEEEQHNKGREDIGSLPSNNKNEHVGRKSSTNLRRARSTAAYLIASSRFGRSSICDSFIKDEEVEFPTVLGRSAATLAQRILHNSTTRCRARAARLHIIMAISLSSIITEEARRMSCNGSPPPMPSLPACAGFVPSTPSAGGSPSGSLPEPFKPFAGQKPQRPSGQSGATAQGLEGLPAASLVRLLSTSLVYSGCGSVLEGIPFNIGFCSDADDHPSSPSSHHTLPHWPLSIDHDDGAPSDISASIP